MIPNAAVIPSGAEGGVEESDKVAFLTDPSALLGVTIKRFLSYVLDFVIVAHFTLYSNIILKISALAGIFSVLLEVRYEETDYILGC